LVLIRHPAAEWVDQYRLPFIHNELMTAALDFFFFLGGGLMDREENKLFSFGRREIQKIT
jgi:hypothetical protein